MAKRIAPNTENNAENLILEQINKLNYDQKIKLIGNILQEKSRANIPISVFRSRLSGLEAIIKFLKEEQGMRIKEIALSLDRKRSTVYNTYRNACRKNKGPIDVSDASILIPLKIFSERKYSILELLIHHLRDNERMTFSEATKAIAKKQSTLRTVYWRYNKKASKDRTIPKR